MHLHVHVFVLGSWGGFSQNSGPHNLSGCGHKVDGISRIWRHRHNYSSGIPSLYIWDITHQIKMRMFAWVHVCGPSVWSLAGITSWRLTCRHVELFGLRTAILFHMFALTRVHMYTDRYHLCTLYTYSCNNYMYMYHYNSPDYHVP